jgi:hypothetical protein
MTLRKIIPWAVLAAVVASPAQADPITASIAAIGASFSAFAGTAVGGFLLRTAASFGLSALAGALAPKQGQQQQRGISTSTTTAGGTQPQTVILGRYATAGHHECPPMTHGISGSDQVKYLTYVISLSDYIISDVAWVIVNGERTRFTTQRADGDGIYGKTANGSRYMDRAWMRWHDGTQTAADPMLLETYAGYERPWTEDHILTGVAYAAMTFKWDENYKQFPEVLFELDGAPLYDPRKDSTVGGSGAQTWGDATTHVFSQNPVVMIYNILRGLRLVDGTVYGLGVDAEDLPLDRWVAAMNICDETASSGGGQRNEVRYKAGIEFTLETEPLAVIEDLLKSCGGRVAECGGFWNISLGPAPFARAHIDDESIIVSNDRERAPFRGLRDTYNAIHASHPDPFGNWAAKDAPAFYKQEWIDADDGRRLVAELNLPTVTQYGQAQRLMQELVTDNRLMITHALTLPPTALGLLPLDTLTWTSAENGYDAKLFEIQSKVIDPATLNVKVALRERSPAEYKYEYFAGTGTDTPGYPEGIEDGAPPPEDNPTDGEYTDPVTGDPLAAERPSASLGDVIALHDGAVSRSTDGGAEWIRTPGNFGAARQISAIDGQGFLVRTAGSEIAYSSAMRRWETLSLRGFVTAPVAIANGDFETGDLADWTVNAGDPFALDATQPPQQRGGAWYVTGDDQFNLSQQISFSRPQGSKLKVYADVYAPSGAEVKVELSESVSGGGIYSFGSVQLRPAREAGVGYSQRSSGDISVWQLFGANAGITHVEFFNAYVSGAYNSSSLVERISLELRDADGAIWSGVAENIQPSPGPGSREDAADILQIIEWSDKSVKSEQTITLTSAQREGQSIVVKIPAGFILPYNYIDYRQISDTAWTCRMDGNSSSGSLDYLNQPYPASVIVNEEGSSDSVTIDGSGFWQRVEIVASEARTSPCHVVLSGGSGVCFDNVSAEVIAAGDTSVRCIARDLSARRHLAATDTGIHAVIDGAATQLCETPFAADFLAGNGDLLIIAAGSDIAISEDDGATWVEHSASSLVFDLHARHGAIAALSDGSIVTISASGLTIAADLEEAHRLAYDARGRRWLAVSAAGVVRSSADLSGWSQEPDMPASTDADARYLLPLDIGRFLGRADGSKDLFWKDRTDAGWSVAPSLTSQIRDMTEIK